MIDFLIGTDLQLNLLFQNYLNHLKIIQLLNLNLFQDFFPNKFLQEDILLNHKLMQNELKINLNCEIRRRKEITSWI